MHTIQDKDYVILTMYSQSNEINCLKYNAKYIYILIKLYLCT